MTNDAFFRQKLTNIMTIINELRQFDTWLGAHANEDVSAEVAHIHNELNVKFVAFYEHLRDTDHMTPQQRAEIEPLLSELIAVSEDLIRKNNAFANNASLLIRILNAIKTLPATGGAGTPAMRQVTQTLERLDAIDIQEAEQVAAGKRTGMAEEAKKMQLAHAEWAKIQEIAVELKQALGLLKNAERGGNVGQSNLTSAETLLLSTENSINSVTAQVRNAILMNVLESGVASNAARKLNDIYKKLIFEADRIKSEKGWA